MKKEERFEEILSYLGFKKNDHLVCPRTMRVLPVGCWVEMYCDLEEDGYDMDDLFRMVKPLFDFRVIDFIKVE